MTMDYINQLIDASIRGTLIGIALFFWGCGLVAVWKWVFGLAKKFLKGLCPNLFKKKEETKAENK